MTGTGTQKKRTIQDLKDSKQRLDAKKVLAKLVPIRKHPQSKHILMCMPANEIEDGESWILEMMDTATEKNAH